MIPTTIMFLLENSYHFFYRKSYDRVTPRQGNVFNIYAYFGKPGVWPRGFPLDAISTPPQFSLEKEQSVVLGIEQGVVNKDPDVDAIYRLTHKGAIYFSKKPTCYLPKGVYCPVNTQNNVYSEGCFRHSLYSKLRLYASV